MRYKKIIDNNLTGRPIVVYKAGSKGLVLGEYGSLNELWEEEYKFRGNFTAAEALSIKASIYNALNGKSKKMTSFRHGGMIAIRFKTQ